MSIFLLLLLLPWNVFQLVRQNQFPDTVQCPMSRVVFKVHFGSFNFPPPQITLAPASPRKVLKRSEATMLINSDSLQSCLSTHFRFSLLSFSTRMVYILFPWRLIYSLFSDPGNGDDHHPAPLWMILGGAKKSVGGCSTSLTHCYNNLPDTDGFPIVLPQTQPQTPLNRPQDPPSSPVPQCSTHPSIFCTSVYSLSLE